ncbi:hypothetical protein [Nitriliruptor alkaliphilus]|uniref:hypothetical protein n=1 Tax=Nitriliruptor alkaliphilus TaxID=427918 RepID=UPI0012ECDA87|nr:hypothetical protein [Nitriliruptor alkaliphilus]
MKRQRRAFAALPFAQRRAVVRAVSRGRAVEDRKLAVHAVVVARRQQRLWRWLWLTGPLIGLTQLNLGWEGALVAALISTVTMALLARFWLVRAQRAEASNLELVPKRQRGDLQQPPR